MFEKYLKIDFEPRHGYISTNINTPLFSVKGEGKNKILAFANAVKNILPNPPRKSFLSVAIDEYPNVPDINEFLDNYSPSQTKKTFIEFLGLTRDEFSQICQAEDKDQAVREIVKRYWRK